MLSQSCCFVNISLLMVVMIFGHHEAHECEPWRLRYGVNWSDFSLDCEATALLTLTMTIFRSS